jgi:hypothetical protein
MEADVHACTGDGEGVLMEADVLNWRWEGV